MYDSNEQYRTSRVDADVEDDDVAADGGDDARDATRGEKVEGAHVERPRGDLEDRRLGVGVGDVVNVYHCASRRAAGGHCEVVGVGWTPSAQVQY